MRLTFLGTAAARPTVTRNVSSLVVQREGELLMFDCGEGTQRQMMRYGTGFTLDDIFFTHLHADHYLGVIGLLRTMSLQAREQPIRLWIPAGGRATMETAVFLGFEKVGFHVEIHELEPGHRIDRGEYEIVPFRTNHGGPCLGYAIEERLRPGRFDPDRARQLGVPEGPLWGKIHRGEPVLIAGATIQPSEIVGSPRPGRKIVVTGDTRPARSVADIARGADLLIHEATFARDEADRARQTGHSTAYDAARIARESGVLRLVITHFSPRYADDPRALEREARQVFPATTAAFDGLVLEVPYRDG